MHAFRKGFHSINVGAIADLDQKFLWVSAKYPGRAHDSKVGDCFLTWGSCLIHSS